MTFYTAGEEHVIKTWKMRRVEYVACMEALRNAYRILVENQRGIRHVGDLGIDGDNIKMDLKKRGC
jgi:hypothetical protein